MRSKPKTNEYDSYYERYIATLPNQEIVTILEEQAEQTQQMVQGLSEKQALFKYGPDKWSIKEVIGHMTDTERIMSYRLLSIARGDKGLLPGFDENAYVEQASFNRKPLSDLLQQYQIVRQSTILLIKSIEEEAWTRSGNANGSEVTVRAIASIIAGHEKHHLVILKERYFGSKAFPG
ncbi:DinB family protein [Fictibacillus terranigra]|uniref:DinB family protein n=1 Tax=Fictibacillus terranigra TaxID=3058424 RepID=A0ABT8E7Y9_9BACL|nr:DinB family protein [Fictibacillus sp. CENA-BCM004]MDN4074017.1 DinB family protein [Fictibacillus sp. CENA-BCM004]